jgi:3-oxoacyl-[acyl-carrier-protein] synthase II
MTALSIIGWGALCSSGIGPEALSAALLRSSEPAPNSGVDVTGLYAEALPSPTAHALVDFNVRALLGRKGTTFLDRSSALALVACGQALEDSGLQVDDGNRHRIGVVLGTTWGSLKSMCEYTRETLMEERPYLVNPILFPNTVMNCAAGQAAIRYGLRGVNAALTGGRLAFLNVLRYVDNILRRGYADVLLAGVVEEFTPHTAWATYLTEPAPASTTAGEGAVVFVVKRADDNRFAGRHLDAKVLSMITGFSPGGEAGGGMGPALEGCIRRALEKAEVEARDISLIAIGEVTESGPGGIEAAALKAVFGSAQVERICVERAFGECHAASGGLQLAALLERHREAPDRDGYFSLLTGWTRDGGIGAAVVRGWSRVGSHHS